MKSISAVKSTLVAGVLAVTFFTAVLAPVNVSAATCSGNGCNGKDPAATGCNANAYLAKRTQFISAATGNKISGAYMDIYYSRTCGTNWVRVTANPFGGIALKVIDVAKTGGFHEDESDWGAGSSYSMMVYAPGSTPVQAWAHLRDTSGKIRAYAPETLIQ
jgi:hypothetical protein